MALVPSHPCSSASSPHGTEAWPGCETAVTVSANRTLCKPVQQGTFLEGCPAEVIRSSFVREHALPGVHDKYLQSLITLTFPSLNINLLNY